MRKTTEVVVDFGGPEFRDKGKRFSITEMGAADAEAWALEALTLISQAGVSLPEGIMRFGWSGLVIVGLDGLMKVDFAKAKPLLDRMMACVQIIPDMDGKPGVPHPINDAVGADIEEVQTRLWLKDKVFELHSGFSTADAMRAISRSAETIMNSLLGTQTFQQPSPPASPVN